MEKVIQSVGYFCYFLKTAQSKLSPNGWKFAQFSPNLVTLSKSYNTVSCHNAFPRILICLKNVFLKGRREPSTLILNPRQISSTQKIKIKLEKLQKRDFSHMKSWTPKKVS
jgi:hypothetical protein